ncbi:hypothetical protein RIR_e14385_A0A2N0NC05_9GLOM [Rhizophagus irregularis DAOM 181602=DAOM 197198]|uniref:Uncharacterized protein n=1 Tax=Rhizophagus irregularis (strain DAOM 181602 / DAOM 197198 / MUCL 43194) TaxID=747089 RepID=U9TM84_RHIID|nr:hypothetical protein RIR_e14385_A0A2N0NC05_9GLOM [Rhizophagus irregularis DAOM 181602=DAOM 197198]
MLNGPTQSYVVFLNRSLGLDRTAVPDCIWCSRTEKHEIQLVRIVSSRRV